MDSLLAASSSVASKITSLVFAVMHGKEVLDIKKMPLAAQTLQNITLQNRSSTAYVAIGAHKTPSDAQRNLLSLDVKPRFQWTSNFGYCGEAALISAGLYYGQYVSQFDVRAFASRNEDQNKRSSQLLLGVNETTAANSLHLNIIKWDGDGSKKFLTWVKKNIALRYPVVIGVYGNMSHFEALGEDEYDHIVPIIGIGSDHAITNTGYFEDDTIYFSDNGLIGNDTPSGSQYIYNSTFKEFQRSRSEADMLTAPYYSVSKSEKNYGFAVTGVKDTFKETVPVRVTTNVNYENTAITEDSNKRPASMPITLTINVSQLKAGVSYNLYRYDSFDKVPDSSFNLHASNASKIWKIKNTSGSTFTTTENINSNQAAIYRAVPTAAR